MVTDLSHYVRVLSCTGYQLYKKYFGRGSADGQDPALEDGSTKEKNYEVENAGFQFDDDINEEKNRDIGKNTQL